ncbi:MAG: hypothetical protein AAF199_09730, partial [Pseudomonadota bacterium]
GGALINGENCVPFSHEPFLPSINAPSIFVRSENRSFITLITPVFEIRTPFSFANIDKNVAPSPRTICPTVHGTGNGRRSDYNQEKQQLGSVLGAN